MTSNTTPEAPSRAPQPTARMLVPDHVVYRTFPAETVLLNLATGRYHGLNATAGRMLEALADAPSIRHAARVIAQRFAQPQDTVERDMCELCRLLLERGLIESDEQPAG
jgi:Coenzyme PQQ synthesis protein D (PqqD)